MDRNIFGRKFAQLRESYGYSMHDIARLSHCSTSLICRTEHGMRIPKTKTLVKLADGFGISKYEMFAMAGLNPKDDTIFGQISELAKGLSPRELLRLKDYTKSLYKKRRQPAGYSVDELTPIQLS